LKSLVDTPIWSAAFRERPHVKTIPLQKELELLILERKVILLGPVRQEVLSGVREARQFVQLKDRLRAFEDFALTTEDYESAAEHFSLCRSKGIQGSHADFLICSVALRHGFSIFTTDKDFVLFAKHLPLQLHQLRD
jgi:predicted nucleic acid-binding protein